MTTRPPLRARAGSAATGLFLGGLAISAAMALAFGPSIARGAVAQTISDRRDQPTPAALPERGKGDAYSANKPTGDVAAPSAISSSTAVTASDRKGKTSYTNPLDHLPAADRAATGGRRE